MRAKPIVDGIEQAYGDQLRVIRIDVHGPAGSILAEQYAFQVTPTFVLLDADGEQLWRSVGSIDPSGLEQIIGKP